MISKGQKINNRYNIIRLIGEGGMANVYLGYDEILSRYVAVKILRGDLAEDEKFVKRFQREAINASALSHPNIVEMYDVGEDDGNYYIVMEYVEGKTLKSLIKRRGALTVTETVDIMKQLTEAIIHAHTSYIIHRDIKPQNVLILDDGTVKITDFGIAMALNNKELTQTNSVMGSVHYLPPEQANGGSATIKSDIYSLGIMMYELITGKIPFKGESAVEIAIKQMKEQLPNMRSDIPNVPQRVENIILKATAKNPKNRYANANEMYQELTECLNEEEQDVARVVFKYPENEEGEKDMAKKTKKEKKAKAEKSNKQTPKKPANKLDLALNLVIGFLLFVCLSLAGGIIYLVLIYPNITQVPEVSVPNVSNMEVLEAEKEIRSYGLRLTPDVDEEYSNDVPEGYVIRTIPQHGRKVKEGTEIKLVVSLGEIGFELEDYVGKNYFAVQEKLENRDIIVFTDNVRVDNPDDYEENEIIKQSPEVGTRVEPGDVVTLTLPIITKQYPDFTDGTWTVNEIEEFGEENDLNLIVRYQTTAQEAPGTILSQSRSEGSTVVSGARLVIEVAEEPEEPPAEEPNDENNAEDNND